MKGGKLPSLMRPILNRTRVFCVILLSLLLAAGCSTDPRMEANQTIERANEKISAHDELFEEVRNTYSGARQSTQESTQVESISEARSQLQEARGRLQEAREEIAGVQELEVSEELLNYSRTLEEALAAQIRAEEREIALYDLLAEEPSLEENRDRAMQLLSEAEEAYAEAESGYEEASQIAASNPELITTDSE